MSAKAAVFLGVVFSFLAVVLGSFGAHGFKEYFNDYETSVYQTGVTYQVSHAFALILLGIWSRAHEVRAGAAGWTFSAGILLFSGSLYMIAFTGIKGFGAIAPLGGTCFLIAWALWARLVWRTK